MELYILFFVSGVTTIGDRLRLTEKVRAELEHVNEDKNKNKIRATLSSEILNQRNILFSSSRGRGKKEEIHPLKMTVHTVLASEQTKGKVKEHGLQQCSLFGRQDNNKAAFS